MAKPDPAHIATDEQLAALENRIAAEYKKAAVELQDKINAYFESFKSRDEETKALIGTIVNGREYTEQDYKQWRLAQMGRGERFEALRDRMAERMNHANEVAAAYINDKTAGIYALNRNYAAYTIEQTAGDIGFDLWDEQTVKRLIVEQPDLMPYYPPERAVNRGIDLAWGKQQITAQVTTGILQGESIMHLADRLQNHIPDMNRASAIRAARTAVTGAQNAGRYDSYRAAKKMGIDVQARWLATLDGRTRHTHAMMDGQVREIDEPFEVDGQKIMFPGCPSVGGQMVVGSLIYNCRCTLIAQTKGVDMSDAKRRAIDPVTGEREVIENMTYQEWYAAKEKQHGPAEMELSRKKVAQESSDRKQFEEYKAVLGKNAPKSFAKFRDLKYNNPEKWEYTKRLAGYIRKYPDSDKKYFDVQEALEKQGIKKGVVLPPVQKQAFILPTGKHDPYHIMYRMKERGITDDEVRGYMKDAKIMFVQWGGKRQMFVSDAGISVITKDGEDWVYKTAWKKNDNDEDTDKIMEAIKHAGL